MNIIKVIEELQQLFYNFYYIHLGTDAERYAQFTPNQFAKIGDYTFDLSETTPESVSVVLNHNEKKLLTKAKKY